MAVIEEGRNFKLVAPDELPDVLDQLEKYLPDSLKFHQTLKTHLNEHVWDFYFYISKSWPEQIIILHFPGMACTPNGNMYESFSVFCPTDQMDNLQLLFDEDQLINWSKPLYLNFTHMKIVEDIESYYMANIGGTIDKVSGDVYVCTELTEDFITEELPCDVQLKELQPEHAQTIHDLYPANDMECVQVFEKVLKILPSYGIFTHDEQLAAWMVQSYYGAMFSMQTKPEFRRKGYGIYLAKHLTKVVKERGYLPFVVIRPENDASISLYKKLGFRKVYETIRATLTPKCALDTNCCNGKVPNGCGINNNGNTDSDNLCLDDLRQAISNEEIIG